MSTETADIESMARDILIAAGGKSWDYTGDFERQHALTIAKSLHSLGYKPSIVHDCCVEAQEAKAGIIEHTEILRYVVVRTNTEGTAIVDLGFGADDRGRERAEASARNLNNIGPLTGFQVAIITALPQEQSNG